jgi:peroxiredoxin
MLELGAAAPDASLLQQDMTPVTPAELAADGPILLSFYLYDWTDTCRSQLRTLRDRHEEFEALGVRVFGVSRDSPYSHRAYAQQQWLNFSLLTDWSGDAVRGFGVSQEFDGLADSPIRSCFLIAGDGTVRAAWSYGDDELPDVDEVLAAAKNL